MTNEELDRLEALAKKATPWPWRPCPQKSFIFGPAHEMIASRSRVQDEGEPEKGTVEIRGFGAGLPMDANHDFIVATSPDVVLRLVAELRSERTERARLRACLNEEATFHGRALAERDDIREERDRLAAELSEARAEVERLRAMVPSAHVIESLAYLTDQRERVPYGGDRARATTKAWLTRFESAKENGR